MNHARQADCGPDPLLGKGHECRFLQHQRQGGGDRERTGFPKSRRRCLVPVDNFYEWKKTGTGKQPYAIALADRGIMPLACLWENWHSPAGERIRTFAIITTQPNELCAELHNRMPVVLKPDVWPAWLGEQPATVSDLKAMVAPYPFDEMFCWPVNTRVGNVRNNDSSLIEQVAGRIATAGRHPKPFTRAVVEYACRRWPFQNEISPLRATL
jgi:hypothetical protein